MENKTFKEDGSPCRLPLAVHGLLLRAKRRRRDDVTYCDFFLLSFCSHLPRFLYLQNPRTG